MKRTKNSIVWVKLSDYAGEDYAGVEVGLKHIGPKTTRRWAKELAALQLRELKRVKELRGQLDADVAPHLFVDADELDICTPDGVEECEQLVMDVMSEVFAGVRAWPELESLPVEQQLAELDRLDLLGHLVVPAREAQAVRPQFRPTPSSAGDDRQEQQDPSTPVGSGGSE